MWLKFEKKILKIVRVIVRAVLKKHASRKTRLKFWVEFIWFIAQVAVWEMPETPQENREIKQKKKFHVWNRLPHILESSN